MLQGRWKLIGWEAVCLLLFALKKRLIPSLDLGAVCKDAGWGRMKEKTVEEESGMELQGRGRGSISPAKDHEISEPGGTFEKQIREGR